MDIEKLARTAINTIKDKWGLPNKGLLAGGSIANLVYNLVYNENAPINDIDVFILDDEDKHNKVLFSFIENEKEYYLNDYCQLISSSITTDKYSIVESENIGIFNYIYYRSKSLDYSIILRSFDLNCTKIGYIIEEDRFIIDNSFVDFIKTKSIKIDTLTTPNHTAIRLAKKKVELNAFVEDFEFKLIQHTLKYRFNDIGRTGFKDKYRNNFVKYESILNNYFDLVEDYEKSEYVKNKYNIDTKIFCIKSNNLENDTDILNINKNSIFDDPNIKSIYNIKDFLFYMRNIYSDEQKKILWKKIKPIYNGKDSLDDVSIEQVELLSNLITYAPGSCKIFKPLTLKEQVSLINKVIKYFKYDYEMVILYLENYINTNVEEIDDFTKICIEIGLRKKRKNIQFKIKKIFNIEVKKEEIEFDIDLL